MTSHPIDSIVVDGVPVSKSDWRSFQKSRERLRVANPDEIRNTDFSGQFGGLYLATLQVDFNLDTNDTTTVDDGVNCIRDLAGNGFFRVAVDATPTQRLVAASGAVTIDAADSDIIVIDKVVGEATVVNLPSAAARSKPVKVVDGKGDAGTNNITISPVSGEEIYGIVDYAHIIDGNGGQVTLVPRADGSGWF